MDNGAMVHYRSPTVRKANFLMTDFHSQRPIPVTGPSQALAINCRSVSSTQRLKAAFGTKIERGRSSAFPRVSAKLACLQEGRSRNQRPRGIAGIAMRR